MIRDRIEAILAGLPFCPACAGTGEIDTVPPARAATIDALVALVEGAVAEEREACAKVADAENKYRLGAYRETKARAEARDYQTMAIAAAQIATAIRGGSHD